MPRQVTPPEALANQGLQAAVIASLSDQAASATTACDTPIKARIDWSTIDPQDVAGSSAANACGAALSALSEACRIAAARDKIQDEVAGSDLHRGLARPGARSQGRGAGLYDRLAGPQPGGVHLLMADGKSMKINRAVVSWCLFDWALTPFHTVINTFVFSIYFSRGIYGDEVAGSAAWSYAASAAGLLVAVLSPLTGAIADRAGHLKRWIGVLAVVNLVPTACLWFCHPQHKDVILALSLIVTATIGGELVLTFYNALLPRLAAPGKVGRLSGIGWGMGYIGGLVALGIALVGLVMPAQPWFGISKLDGANLRMTGPLIALWMVAFGWPLFVFVKDEPRPPISLLAACRTGYTQLRGSLAKLPQQKTLLWFLIASGLYRDGLNTLFAVGGQYAAGTFGMSFEQIMEFGIGINIAAGLGCLGFGWLDDRIGPKRTIQIALVGILITGTALALITEKMWFTPVALCLGIFIGPAQSAGRSLMARLAPPEMVTEMFGLYQFAGRSISFMGPLAFALTISVFHNQRLGIATILLFIFGGLVLMRKVRVEKSIDMLHLT